jgi:hypothetical protein
LHIIDDDNAKYTGRLKNLILVRRPAGTESTTNTLDDDLKQRQPNVDPLSGDRVQCSL